MAEIKIYGTLVNKKDGTLANADQIKLSDGKSVEEKLSEIGTSNSELQNIVNANSSNITDLQTEREKLDSPDVNTLINPGIFDVTNGVNSPDDTKNGFLTVSEVGDKKIKQVWNATSIAAVRTGNIVEEKELRKTNFSVIENGSELVYTSDNYEVSLIAGKTYILKGRLNGHIKIINSTVAPTNATKLILNNVDIDSDIECAINYTPETSKLVIDLPYNTVNYISSYPETLQSNTDYSATILSNNNIDIRGAGSLAIRNNWEQSHGIKGSEVKICLSNKTNPGLDISANHDGIHGSSLVEISNGFFNIHDITNSAIEAQNSDSTKGELRIRAGKFTISNSQFGISGAISGRVEGLETSFEFSNVNEPVREEYKTEMHILDTVQITGATLAKEDKLTYFGEPRVWSVSATGEEVNLSESEGMYNTGSLGDQEFHIRGYFNNKRFISTGLKVSFILEGCYIENNNAPIFSYTPSKKSISLKSLKKDVLVYGTNYIVSSGTGNLVESGGNIQVTTHTPIFFKGNGIPLKGSEIILRGDGDKYFYETGEYSVHGTLINIGADPDDIAEGTAGNSDQNIFAKNIYARLSGSDKKGFVYIYEYQKGDIYTDSISGENKDTTKETITSSSLGNVYVSNSSHLYPSTFTTISPDIKDIKVSYPNKNEIIKSIKDTWIIVKDASEYPSEETIKNLIKENSIRSYESIEDATADLENLQYGNMVAIKGNRTDDYNINYNLYIVIELSDSSKGFKKIEGGGSSGGDSNSVVLTIEDLYVDGVRQNLENSLFEANIGSKIDIKYSFVSMYHDDVKGTVYFKVGATLVNQERVLPVDGQTNSWSYDTSNLEAGTYKFSIYGSDVTGSTSPRQVLNFEVGGLNISSSFNEEEVLTAGNNLQFPVKITTATPENTITAHVKVDGAEVKADSVETNTTFILISGSNIEEGSHTLEVYLTNTKGKESNHLKYSIIAANMGIIYVLSDKDTYSISAGSRLDVVVRTIQKGQEKGTFTAKLKITDVSGNPVELNNKLENTYNFNYGKNNLQLIGLNYKQNDSENQTDDYTKYTLNLTVSSEDSAAVPVTKTFEARVAPNNYNISASTDGLLCWFDASGKSNNDEDREQWSDKSGNGVKATLGNFNWNSNGWLPDDEGNTALTLNSGAYVELDIAPFTEEPNELTISIDYETSDILDSSAKVVSCLRETESKDYITYYLRDSWGDYIKNDTNISGNALDTSFTEMTELENREEAINFIVTGITNATEKAEKLEELNAMNDSEILEAYKNKKFSYVNNILRYCMFAGEYCWLNGIQYIADGKTPYDVTYSQSERTINLNKGDDDLDYNVINKHFSKKTGKTSEDVIKQQGFYIDTQYGVLSNSSSKASAEEKFHMNFSQNTRTRMDFIITRNGKKEPYFLSCMAGYVNGVITGIQEITDQDTFKQVDPKKGKYRVYLGGKGYYDENENLIISDTGACKIYSFRIYNKALDHEQVLYNYAAEIPNYDKKVKVIDNNGLVNKTSLAHLPRLCLMGANVNGRSTIRDFIMQLANVDESQISDLKAMKEPAYISYTDPDNPSKNWLADDGTFTIPVRLKFQGTSSLVYPMKNYKFRMHKSMTISNDGTVIYGKKLKKDLLGAGIGEHTFTIKVNYMDSSNVRNTGSANFIADYNEITGNTPPMDIDSRVRTTIYGYPILLYYKEFPDSVEEEQFLGVGCLNLDKSDTDSFGLDKEITDPDGTLYDFGKAYYIEDEFSKDILVRKQKSDGSYEKIKLYDDGDMMFKDYDALYNKDGLLVAAVSEKGYLRSVSNQKISNTSCFELKANSGADGAGGFGNYFIESVANDVEPRYPDDGDIEEEEFDPYIQDMAKPIEDRVFNKSEMPDLTFKQYKSPYFFHFQRLIKWVRNASRDEFINNIDKHFNRNYLMDYYLTILLLGGVDSLGKNLMMGTWGPENLLFITNETKKDDPLSFEYQLTSGETVRITPKKNKSTGVYKFATDSDGKQLFYDENCYSRVTKQFKSGYSEFVVTKTPGECIWYPMFYDIDTILGVDNSGQLLYDVDIELGDQLDDGTMVYNTADSFLWTKVKDYLGSKDSSGGSLLSNRWSIMTSSRKFSYENLVDKFYYQNIIAKVPEYYYNKDCFTKYIHEGPDDTQVGSKSYLYCCHGSSYEHIKKWIKERIYYLNSMFGKVGTTNASLRFNYGNYDGAFNDADGYYNSYAALAANNPDIYQYSVNPETNAEILTSKITGLEIKPINFNFKTYQPGYVGIKWFNGGQIHYKRIKRNKSATIQGNVKTSGDAEVFIYGGENIKEIGDMSPYNAKQVDFKYLTKLNKLQLGSADNSCVINKLDLGENNTYLAELKLVRCGSLTSVDVSRCINLKEVDMTDSGITNISLPTSGGALESIAYSNSVTTINLENFVNLKKISAPSLANLNRFVIKNCPKILGTKEKPNVLAWSLLQQTYNSLALTDIQVTTYGRVAPKVISSTYSYFFPDRFYSYATAPYIRGEINYTGKTIPANYTKFADAFPYLTITYNNIEDASEMFANYKNLNCISKMSVYAGQDIYGNNLYKDVFYWTDSTKELKDKWHTPEMREKYGVSTSFEGLEKFYQKDNTYYRLLGIYDEEDLDIVRVEIKKALSNFNRFTNLTGLFRNMEILDYIDPDTFNNIDISTANTTEMFAGCKNLRYFEVPNDIVKNEKEIFYYNKDPETDGFIKVDKGEYDPSTGGKIEETGKYVNPFTNEVTDSATSVYRKGMRNLGNRMFLNCKKVAVLIHKYEDEKITIAEDAFQYGMYDSTTNASNYTFEKPVILFEHDEKDILETTTEAQTEIDGESHKNIPVDTTGNLYYKVDIYDERVFNLQNNFVSMKEPTWLREVYFGVNSVTLDDSTKVNNVVMSYATRKDNKIILLDASGIATSFNIGSETSYDNVNEIYSIASGALSEMKETTEIEIPLPKYDCLDNTHPRLAAEISIANLFTREKYDLTSLTSVFNEKARKVSSIYICNTEVIPTYSFTGVPMITKIGLSNATKVIKARAFSEMPQLENVVFSNKSTTPFVRNEQLTTIENDAFSLSALKEFTLPNSVKKIGTRAFSDNKNLVSFSFNRDSDTDTSITVIPEGFFIGDTKLTFVTGLSRKLTRIEKDAFNGCKKLVILKDDMDEDKNYYNSINLGIGDHHENFEYFTNIEYIGDNAFLNVRDILDKSTLARNTLLKFPSSIKYIGTSAFAVKENPVQVGYTEFVWEGDVENGFKNLVIGAEAFSGIKPCWRITSSSQPINNCIFIPKLLSIGSTAFKMPSTNNQFEYALSKNSKEEIGDEWVASSKKIIFEYYGLFTDSSKYKFFYLLSSDTDEIDNGKYDGKAYLQNIGVEVSAVEIPEYTEFENKKFKVAEILAGAFDICGDNLSAITFDENSKLSLIERNVLTSSNLLSINTGSVANVIPETLNIETGNNLHNTTWFELLKTSGSYNGKFITLGKNIIGYIPEKGFSGLLDLTDSSISGCTTIFDSAFKDMKEITSVKFNENIIYIYSDAFSGTSLTKIDLPSKVTRIDRNAFFGNKFERLVFPSSLTYVGDGAFAENQNKTETPGTLKYVDIKDGARISGSLFELQQDISMSSVPNQNLPTSANISLKEIHIPKSMPSLIDTSFSQLRNMSQTTKIYLGTLKINENPDSEYIGTYLCENKILYTDSNGFTTYDETTDGVTNTPKKSSDGKQLYCPLFFYNMAQSTKGFKQSYLETTEQYSVCPLGDFVGPATLYFVRRYDNAVYCGGEFPKDMNNGFTREDLLRIIAGYTSDTSNDISTITLSNKDYKLIQQDIPMILQANKHIRFAPVMF